MNKKTNDDYERYFFSFYICLYLIIEVINLYLSNFTSIINMKEKDMLEYIGLLLFTIS